MNNETNTPSPQKLDPKQLGELVLVRYKAMVRAEKTYKMVDEVMKGKRKMPIISFPLSDGQTGEVDIHAFFKDEENVKDAEAKLIRHLTPWNNFFARQFLFEISRLGKAAAELLDISAEEGSSVKINEAPLSFIDAMDAIHYECEEFSKIWVGYVSVIDEPPADMEIQLQDGTTSSIGQILQLAGVEGGEAAKQVVSQILGSSRSEQTGALCKCLKRLVILTNMAKQRATQGQ